MNEEELSPLKEFFEELNRRAEKFGKIEDKADNVLERAAQRYRIKLTETVDDPTSELMWMVGQINAQRWRFHYGRMATMHRLRALEVDAPSHELPESMDLEAKLRNFRRGLRVMTDGESGGTTVEQRFHAMKERWIKERGPASAISRLAMHPAYQQIIGMGEAVVPLIMGELERQPDHWFWALNAITGANPVHKASQGKITKMAEDWLKWGRDQGFTW